jgi:hypothetical protein
LPGDDWFRSIDSATKQQGGEDHFSADYEMKINCSGQDQPLFHLSHDANFRHTNLDIRRSVLHEPPAQIVAFKKNCISSLFGFTVRRMRKSLDLSLPTSLSGVFNDDDGYRRHRDVVLGRHINSRWAAGDVHPSGFIYFPFVSRKRSKKRQKRPR